MDTISTISTKKEYKKKARLNSKAGRYFLAKQKGMSTEMAKSEAGYMQGTENRAIEGTKTYQAIEAKYAETLETLISKKEVAMAHIENIRQDTDRGARNKAIEMYKAYTEPEGEIRDTKESVIIVFKESKVAPETQDIVNIKLKGNDATDGQLEGKE
jgi:hypothetical protein